MYCKKCGFTLKENVKICPFCNANQEEIVEIVAKENLYFNSKEEAKTLDKINVENSKTQKEKKTEFKVENNYVPYGQKEEVNKMTNEGYVNLKTGWWHHLLIASLGYLAMYLLFDIMGSLLITHYRNKGYDFSCIADDTLSCSIGAEITYNKISMICQIVAELLVVLIVVFLFRKYIGNFFKSFKNKKTYKWFGIMLPIMYGASYVYTTIITILQLETENANQDAVTSIIQGNPLLGFFFVVIAAPIFEEVIFRFGVFRAFTHGSKKREIIGLILTTFVFAGVHMIASVEEAIIEKDVMIFVKDLPTFPSYLIGAFCLTFAYYKSKNLSTNIMMHMSWNMLSFISILLLGPLENEATSELINMVLKLVIR